MSGALTPGCADALLFDLGRVVIDIDFSLAIERWASHARCPPQNLATRFTVDESYRQHEIGKLGAPDYFASLRKTLRIDIPDDAFLDGWNAIFLDAMPGIETQLTRAAQHLPLYAFSNTNTSHVEHFLQRYSGLTQPFKTMFLSSTIGLRKPDAAAYDHVVAQIGVPARRIVFFDDLAENIAGAEARGLLGVHVTSKDSVANALTALGL